MANRKNRGRYITKVDTYDIYAKDTHKPVSREKVQPKNFSPQIASTTYGVYHAKKLVKGGFNTKNEAINYINGSK